MKLLLTTLNAKYIHLNLAIRLLYTLNKEREGIDWKEFTIKENPEDIANACKDYEVVAFSCYIWNITQTLTVAEVLKKINPDIKILLGGPEVSYEYEDIIALPFVDYIIVGEGEIPFQIFLDSYPSVLHVPGLVYQLHGKTILNLVAANFDVQKYAGLNPYQFEPSSELYNKVCYIETSRGCPYKCEFCLASLDNKVRYLPMEDIKSNLLYLMQHGRVIKFLDRTFNVKKDFTIEIFQFILDNHLPQNVFQFEITADIVHPDIVKFIQEKVPKGLFRFEIGIQTVNQQANLEVSRKQNFDKTASVIRQLENKIEMHLDLIVGLPLDYWSDIKYSIEEVFKLRPPELQLGFLKFLKGTPVRHKYEQHQYQFDPLPPYQIIESKYLSKQELHRITFLEEALELYWNKKRALHTLTYASAQGSIFDFLLQLGEKFQSKSNFHKHTLKDAFTILYDYVKETFPTDNILLEMVALDYYLQSKIKPGEMFLQEVSRERKLEIIQEHKLNHHKYRHVILPVSFDFHQYKYRDEIKPALRELVIQYDGVNLPIVVA